MANSIPPNPTNPVSLTNPRGKRFKNDYSLRMDNLSDEVRYPTEKDWEEYNDWKEHRTIRKYNYKHNPNNPLNPATIRAQHEWKYGKQFKKKYRVSSPAMEGLRKLARQHGYGHDKSEYAQGSFSKFIRALANPIIKWEDTRDDDIKATDHFRIPNGRSKLWFTTDQRKRRLPREFTMTDSVIEALYKLSCKHMVFLTPNPTAEAVLRKGTMIASLLEVIGRGLLTPQGMPPRPDPPRYYRYYKPFRNVFIYGPAPAIPPRI